LQTFNKYIDWLVLIFFFITIGTPLMIKIGSSAKQISTTEKRRLAQRPGFPDSIDSLTLFPQAFENYFKDQYGLRNQLVQLYNLVKLKIGDSASKKVIIGKKGWLFLNGQAPSSPINNFNNADLFTPTQLRKFAIFLTTKRDFLNKHGIQYLFIVAPDKRTIYGDMLPSRLYKPDRASALTQLIQYLKKNTQVQFVDLRPILLANKNNTVSTLYYKHDTHWNYYGGNFAQFEIAKKLDALMPHRISPYLYRPDEFTTKPTDGVDLATFIGLRDKVMKNHRVTVLKEKLCGQVIVSEFTSKAQLIICEKSSLTGVVFRDSFFDHLQSYFTRYFKAATYYRKQASMSDLERLVEEEKPEIVIEEIVERVLPIRVSMSAMHGKKFKQKIFDANDQVVYDLNLTDPKTIKPGNNLIISTPDPVHGNALHIKATGPDPQMELSALGFDPDSNYIIKIRINTVQAERFQLFFSIDPSKGYPFSEKNSVFQSLNKGDNEFYIILDAGHLGSRLRIDPGHGKGEFRIDEFKCKKILNWA